MRKIIKVLILLGFFSAYVTPTQASLSCTQVYSRLKQTSSTNIGFSQNFIGHIWASIKAEKLKADYASWSPKNGKKSKKTFILEITSDSPLPVYRDVYGQIRLLDNHHKFFAISEFMGNKSFNINYKIEKNYMTLNPKTGNKWTEKEMMQDLIDHNFLFIKDNDNPKYSDLKSIPNNIKELPDYPERTIISLVFAAFETPMKGSDFTPMIQLLLADFMADGGYKVIYKTPYSETNIDKIKETILTSKELMDFLMNHINRENKPKRVEEIESFFNSHLGKLNS